MLEPAQEAAVSIIKEQINQCERGESHVIASGEDEAGRCKFKAC